MENIKDIEGRMQKSVDNLKEEYVTIRAGRANPHILDRLRVDYYGTPTSLQQVANISVPEARMIQIQPWEASLVKEIEKDDCDAVIGGYRRITETGKILKTLKLNDGEWSKYMIMAPWAKIYRTQYLIQNDITFLENNLGEDMYFNLKALLLGNVKSIDYVGYNWFFNTKSVSNTIQKNITQLQVFELIDSCYNMLKENGILEKNYEMIEAHFIKYIIWLILFSTKKLDYKTISKEYDKLFNWLKQKFPNYKKNKVVRLWKPKGELFSIRLIVITMSIANKVGLGKVLVYVYSIL